MFNKENKYKYQNLFFEESRKILSDIQTCCSNEKSEQNDLMIYKCAHSLKGMAQAMGMDELSKESHKFEGEIKSERLSYNDYKPIIAKLRVLLENEEKHLGDEEILESFDDVDEEDEFDKVVSLMVNIIEATFELKDDNKSKVYDYLKEIYNQLIPSRVVQLGKIKRYLLRVISTYQREVDKEIRFTIKGERIVIENDKFQIITRVLVQLVRNAITHGIELPWVRKKEGKLDTPEIVITATVKERELIITLEDNGRGVNYEKLRRIIVNKKLATKEEMENIQSQDLLNEYLFYPELSTSDQVDEFSGQGIGLSEAKSILAPLSGIIVMESEEKCGSKFTIRLPTKLFYIDLKLFKVGHKIIGIEPHSIEKIADYSKEDQKRDFLKSGPVVMDFVRFFNSDNSAQQKAVDVLFSGRQYRVLIEEEIDEKEVLVLTQKDEMFWNAFTEDAKLVSVLNYEYVLANYC